MLLELRVRDFALIHHLSLCLGAGLNAVTGETGSGKSLLVTALELLAGGRPRGGPGLWVRAGAERAVLEGVFDLPPVHSDLDDRVESWFAAHLPELAGRGWRGEGQLVVVRVLESSGRTRARVHGASVTLTALAELVGMLVEVNGQFAQRAATEPAQQLAWFDEVVAAGEPGLVVGRDRYERTRRAWLAEREHLERIEERAANREGRSTFLRLAVEELERLAPRAGEGSELLRERELARQSTRVVEELGRAAGELSEGDDPVLGQVASVLDRVAAWSRAAPRLEQVAGELSAALVHLEEGANLLLSFLGGCEADPERLDALETRLVALERAARRHGVGVDELARLTGELRVELDGLDDLGADLARARGREESARAELAAAAAELAACRRAAGARFAQALRPALDALGLEDARVEARFRARGGDDGGDPRRRYGPLGEDELELSFRPNPGEPPRPLAAIASGGEVARVFLALRCAMWGGTPSAARPLLVFDEVDAAVGGRLAPRVADVLGSLARHGQVLAVTHQPAIAARADHHLLVTKRTRQGRTSTVAVELEGRERLVEVAAMIGGSGRSPAARAEAQRMLGESASRRPGPSRASGAAAPTTGGPASGATAVRAGEPAPAEVPATRSSRSGGRRGPGPGRADPSARRSA